MKTDAKISLATPEPITPQADRETSELISRIDVELAPISSISYTILLCGPRLDPPSPAAVKRQEIFEALKQEQHRPIYSEALPRRENISQRNVQRANAQAVDLVIVLVDIQVPRTIIEAYNLCEVPELRQKLHLLIPVELKSGDDGDETFQEYEEANYVMPFWYTAEDIPACNLRKSVMTFVKARQKVASQQPKQLSGE